MQKNYSGRFLKLMVSGAFLAALSIVLGKYLAFGVGNVLRFSFENLPIIFAGMAFGSPVGVLVGIVADLVGCILVGYEINPLVTVGAAAIGLISGGYHYFFGRAGSKRAVCLGVTLFVFISHIIGSVLIKTLGLSIFYDMPLFILMLWRLLNYAIVGALECVLLCCLINNKAIKRQILAMNRGTKGRKNDLRTGT